MTLNDMVMMGVCLLSISGDQTVAMSEPQPTLLGNVIYAGGTAQVQQDRNLPMTFTSEAHMSSGTMIQQPQQPQHQPVSTDQGTLDIPAQAFLISLATNEEMEQEPQDEERTTSLQRINAIANELMSSVEATGGAVGGNERVIVQNVPHSNILSDLTYSNLETVDIAAFQDVTATINDDLVYSAYNDSVMDMNNTSNSNNNNNNPMG